MGRHVIMITIVSGKGAGLIRGCAPISFAKNISAVSPCRVLKPSNVHDCSACVVEQGTVFMTSLFCSRVACVCYQHHPNECMRGRRRRDQPMAMESHC